MATIRSGTIKTLAALAGAMTVGAGVLILLETEPARPTIPLSLQAVKADRTGGERAIVRNTEVPLQYIKWRNIVIHDAPRADAAVARGCHFLIGDDHSQGRAAIQATRLWRRQQDGDHIFVPGYSFNDNSIGVCLLRDCGRQPPTAEQFVALVNLVQALQVTFQIPPDHVYLHSDLTEEDCPGRLFPHEAFRANLRPCAG